MADADGGMWVSIAATTGVRATVIWLVVPHAGPEPAPVVAAALHVGLSARTREAVAAVVERQVR